MIIGTLLALLFETAQEVRSRLQQASNDWQSVFGAADFGSVEQKLDSLVGSIQQGDLGNAIAALQAREAALLNGRDPSDLEAPERHNYLAMLKVEEALGAKELERATSSQSLAQLLVNDLLPEIEHAAPIVLAIFV